MDWWQTLLVATAPAAVTAFALYIQQRRSDQLEHARLADLDTERAHQRQLAGDLHAHQRQLALDEQSHQLAVKTSELDALTSRDNDERMQRLADEWRQERRQVHSKLLAFLDEANTALESPRLELVMGSPDDHVEVVDSPRAFDEEFRNSLVSALNQVRLIGSSASVKAAEESVERVVDIERSLFLADTLPVAKKVMKIRFGQFKSAREAYQQSARDDLGTQS
jgi:hypothetical protein